MHRGGERKGEREREHTSIDVDATTKTSRSSVVGNGHSGYREVCLVCNFLSKIYKKKKISNKDKNKEINKTTIKK